MFSTEGCELSVSTVAFGCPRSFNREAPKKLTFYSKSNKITERTGTLLRNTQLIEFVLEFNTDSHVLRPRSVSLLNLNSQMSKTKYKKKGYIVCKIFFFYGLWKFCRVYIHYNINTCKPKI